ncbi:regulator of g signaling superfamily protein [Rutstroemia sp. NJR-2017a BVV2]|nr:regulator of g signaling superfamily protein [Rutstroemia sp. NJR-2017a BVV2]
MGLVPYLGQVIANVNYRRPDYVSTNSSAASMDDLSQTESSGSAKSQGIPEALSFDRIINGGTCPPMTVREFMNYLEYIELAPENLQFFLWFRDYASRFEQSQSQSQSKSHNPFTTPPPTAQSEGPNPPPTDYKYESSNARSFDADDERPINLPVPVPVKSPITPEVGSVAPWEMDLEKDPSLTKVHSSVQASYRAIAHRTFTEAGLEIPPTNLPFRDEIDRIIAIYIASPAPRQLNLSFRLRHTFLIALTSTTDPSAFLPVVKSVESSLRFQAHPNFVRWSICNGNKPRQVFARGLGAFLIVAGLLYALLTTLSGMSRGWRAFAAFFWVLGISTLYAAWRGMCVVLHGLHHRHLRPWELWESEEEEICLEGVDHPSVPNSSSSPDEKQQDKADKKVKEDYPWVKKYEKRNIIRKIFDREVWVQEPALRQIQDVIFLQSLLFGVGVGGIATVVFLVVPGGGFF